jgi:hypothetical protein
MPFPALLSDRSAEVEQISSRTRILSYRDENDTIHYRVEQRTDFPLFGSYDYFCEYENRSLDKVRARARKMDAQQLERIVRATLAECR